MRDYRKIARLWVALLVFFLAILSCNLLRRPLVSDGTPFEVWTPTSRQPIEQTALPVETPVIQPVHARAQLGTYKSTWLTYDPAVWDVEPWLEVLNPSGEPIQQLIHRSLPACFLHDNLGHGAPETWSFEIFTHQIAQAVFQVEQWTDTASGNAVLVVYQYPAGEQTTLTRRIELEPGAAALECISAAEVVIGQSLADITE